MKKILALIFILTLTGIALTASPFKALSPDRRVLVVHYQDEDYAGYRDFDRNIDADFSERGVDASIHNVYLNLNHYSSNDSIIRASLADELQWNPELIVIERDMAFSKLADIPEGVALIKCGAPVLAVGIQSLSTIDVQLFPDVVIVRDEVDFNENLDIAYAVSGFNMVVTEIDPQLTSYDSILLESLRGSISNSSKYVDNTDFSKSVADFRAIGQIDKIMVLSISASDPESNIVANNLGATKNERYYVEQIKNIEAASAYLNVKTDIYSDILCRAHHYPQFTAVREGFYNGMNEYLCGYFASYGTVASDVARYGAELLSGKRQNRVLSHEKQHYMNWKAMRAYGMKFDEYSSNFNITDVPFWVQHALIFYITLFFLAALVSIAIIVMNVFKRSARNTALRESNQRLYEANASLNAVDSFVTTSVKVFRRFASNLHPDSKPDMDYLFDLEKWDNVQSIADPQSGFNLIKRKDVRLQLSRDGKQYNWWRVSVGLSFDEEGNRVPVFVCIKIDDVIARENKLHEAQYMVMESQRRDTFIKTISHQMRTPLNSIVGFSELLSIDKDLSVEERSEMVGYVKSNSEALSRIVNNILVYSRLESGRMVANNRLVNAYKIVKQIADEWNEMGIPGLELQVFGAHEEVMANIDPDKLKECFNQLLDNAIKFSNKKKIYIGWYYKFEDKKIEFFVEDEGWGMPEEFTERSSQYFWKADDFSIGAGLGLSIVKAYVILMGGTLSVKSIPNFGTKIKMIFDGSLES